jgi:hypothetical protein
MDVAATVTDRACRHRIHPLKIDERSHARIQLHVMAPEFWMATYLTPKWPTVNLDGSDFLVSKDSLVTTEQASEETHLVG